MKVVFDASVAIKLVVDEGDRAAARELVTRGDAELIAPAFLLLEAGNILWKKARRNEIASEQAVSGLSDLHVLFDRLIPTTELLAEAFSLAFDLTTRCTTACTSLVRGATTGWSSRRTLASWPPALARE